MLVRAHRAELPEHAPIKAWLDELASGESAFGLSDLVLSGFTRVSTHPRIFEPPTPLDAALEFVRSLRERPHRVEIAPGRRHWAIFIRLCHDANAKGNLVPDAYHAALAIESGSEWVTTDRGFGRFPGLRWRHPLD